MENPIIEFENKSHNYPLIKQLITKISELSTSEKHDEYGIFITYKRN